MNDFWKERFDEHPDAEGVDFVPCGQMPWDKKLTIHQTNTKEDFENPYLCYPRSNYFFWKMVNGVKQYILTPKMEESFQKEFCSRCGSQRCPGDSEAISTCGYSKQKPKMEKRAYVSVTYLFMLEPSGVGISEDCSKREFEAAIDGYMNRMFEEVEEHIGAPNDIEIDINGDFD